MVRPENTSNRDPMLHLLGAMSDGTSKYITDMEASGQRQLVHSDRLPTDARGEEAAYLALGFTFADPDPDDPLFRPAALPAGWRKQGSDHDMWSYVVDNLGRNRVAIFYKAAFYDRRAFMRLETVSSYAYCIAYCDDAAAAPVFDDTWCTPTAFVAELRAIRAQEQADVERWQRRQESYAAEYLAEAQSRVARIDALLQQYQPSEAKNG